MQRKNKKLLGILACAGFLATAGFVTTNENTSEKIIQTVKAATVKARSYGVDVSAYQSSSVASSAKAGSKFAIVKVSEGTSYRNPKASAQIASAKVSGMMPMAYHFALFGSSSARAKSEAKYAIASAKAYGLPKGSYIACDWETGDGNNVNGGKNASAKAIIAFMKAIDNAGYQPLLYSGAHLLNNNINTSKVTAAYPNSLWVASYATMGRIDKPDFGYFPSMNGIIIWQFTDNWRGLNVDGNISLLPLSTSGSASSQAPSSKTVSTKKTVQVKSYGYDKSGNKNGKVYNANKKVKVYGGAVLINGESYYRVGSNSYIKLANVDGVKRVLKKTASVYNSKGKYAGVAQISAGSTVPTYGEKTINGKKYYKINKNRYVLVADFK